jgi:hypothetical protein
VICKEMRNVRPAFEIWEKPESTHWLLQSEMSFDFWKKWEKIFAGKQDLWQGAHNRSATPTLNKASDVTLRL